MTSENQKQKKGAAMIWAVVFGLVIATLGTLLLTLLLTATSANMTEKRNMQADADLNQIGEYFLRSLGYKEDFPTGNETDYSGYAWLDQNAREFFSRCHDKYGYTYTVNTKHTEDGKFLEGYRDKGNVYLLTVKDQNNAVALRVAVNEEITYNNEKRFIIRMGAGPESKFEIKEWTVNPNGAYNDYTEIGNGGLLKRLWRSIVGSISGIVVKPTEYKVTYQSNGGSDAGGPYLVERGKTIKLPAASEIKKDGAEFINWKIQSGSVSGHSSGATLAGGTVITPKSNVTLTAMWRDYVVTFNRNGQGELEKSSLSGVIDKLPGASSNTHYFVAWWTSADDSGKKVGEKDEKYIPKNDITLYAHWSPRPIYKIEYEKGDATEGTAPESQDKYQGIDTNLKSTVLYKTVQSSDNVTVKFDINGGSGNAPGDKTVKKTSETKYESTRWKDKNSSDTYGFGAAYTKDNAVTLVPDFSQGKVKETSSSGGTLNLPSAPTAPAGKEFIGWYTSKTGGNKIGDGGETKSYTGGSATFYAHWKCKMIDISIDTENCTVNDSKNNVSVPYGSTVAKDGGKITFTAPSGYGIDGMPGGTSTTLVVNTTANDSMCKSPAWQNLPSGAITSKPTNNIKVKYTKYYTISISTDDGATCSTSPSGEAYAGQNVSVTVQDEDGISSVKATYKDSSNKTQTLLNYSDLDKTSHTYTFTMPAANVSITVDGETGGLECFTGDTLISMADGTKKRVDQLSVGENIVTFNHNTGYVSSSAVAYIYYSNLEYDITKLHFENGTEITVLQAHCFYDMQENKYVEINKDNVQNYVGHKFFCVDSMSFVELTSYELSRGKTKAYSVLSEYDINHVANGFLAMSDEIEGLFNYFDYDENMKFDEAKMQEDIENYGLVPYEMFKDFCSEEEFEVFNCKYLGISIEKGLTTYESLIERMLRFTGGSI